MSNQCRKRVRIDPKELKSLSHDAELPQNVEYIICETGKLSFISTFEFECSSIEIGCGGQYFT